MRQTHGTWGERQITFQWDGGIVTLLYLMPMERCSYHRHTATWNRFTCITGEVYILTDKGHETRLLPKQSFDVEPGIRHEFRTYGSTAIVEEIAFVSYDPADIHRESLGGPLENDEQA